MTVDLEEIRKIVELMNEHELTYFHIEKKDFHLKLKKGVDLEALPGLLAGLRAPAAAAAPAACPPAAEAPPAEEQGAEITSPMVGTFYRRPAPEADNFVEVGDAVSEGQTICIIEAMKVMNEIKSDRAGTITRILVEDGTPVQFGDALFRIS